MFVLRCKKVSSPAVLAIAIGAAALAGCQTDQPTSKIFGAPADPQITGTVNPQDKTVENTQKWATYWQKNPKDVEAAISYAAHLKALKKNDQALAVLRKSAISNPEEPRLLTAYGKQLIVMGELAEANKVLAKATRSPGPTWQAYSLHGTVLDRLGKHEEARTQYKTALGLVPNKTSVMNNLAMSHAMSGDPKTAEGILLKAISANPGERQGTAAAEPRPGDRPAGRFRAGAQGARQGAPAAPGGGQHGVHQEDDLPAQHLETDSVLEELTPAVFPQSGPISLVHAGTAPLQAV